MENQNKFVIVADDEVIMNFTVPAYNDAITDGILAGLRSRPIVVELPEGSDPFVGFGWKYVNGYFLSPSHDHSSDNQYEVD